MKLHAAMTLAERIQRELAPFCHKCEIAGSIRRARPEVNDIDLVILPKPEISPANGVADIKARCKEKCRVISDGRQNFICAMRLKDGSEFQLDIFFAHYGTNDLLDPQPSNFGSLLLLRIGSKEHNIKIAQRAKSMGMKWSPYQGLLAGGNWLPKSSQHGEICEVPRNGEEPELEYYGGKIVASETEEQIFKALGMEWISPALRETSFNAGPSIHEILSSHDSQPKATS